LRELACDAAPLGIIIEMLVTVPVAGVPVEAEFDEGSGCCEVPPCEL
jgi:hypothetical protein